MNASTPPESPSPDKKMSRRDFVDWIIRGGIAATLAGMLLPALEYLWPVMGRGAATGMEEVGRADDIPVGGSKKVIVAGSAMLLIRTPKEIKAYSAICTHLGCIVDWDGVKHEIVCPCHAGIFDIEGRQVSGPPPKPLAAYSVRIADGKIFVKL
jgi:cytochrome b6-f complex iron-sulfur subunit